jgi:GNAT superfamily N-acetyltransferase
MENASELDFEQPVIVNDSNILLQIQELRQRAWSANGEVPEFITRQNILKDDQDVRGLHWAVFFQGRPIAAARLNVSIDIAGSPDPEALDGYEQLIDTPVASMTRLVVHPAFRRRGLPAMLRKVRLEVAMQRGCKSIVAVAEEESVMRSMEDIGFVRLGPTKIRYLEHSPSIVLLKKLTPDRQLKLQSDREPILVTDTAMLVKIQQLRQLSWSADGEVPDFIARQDILRDEHDVHGRHWVILHEGRPIAAARLCIHDDVTSSPDPEALDGYEHLIAGPIASLTRLVVHPSFRGTGLSGLLTETRLRIAEQSGSKSIVAIAELPFRVAGLEHLGFENLGPTRLRYLSLAPSYVLLKKIAPG